MSASAADRREYIQVQLIPEKLEQYHLNLSSVATAIGSADFTYPAGDTIVGGQKLSVSAEPSMTQKNY